MAESDDAETLRDHMNGTYFSLRMGMGIVGALLPWVLWLGATERLQGSMSAYYYTSMRDVFVGSLVAIGFFLVLYKGFSSRENWALNFAGGFAVGVALVPTNKPDAEATLGAYAHGAFALAFFGFVAYVCIFLAADTLSLIRDTSRARRFQAAYRLIGAAMIVAPLSAAMLAFFAREWRATLFVVEAAAVTVFAVYWLVKSKEMKETNGESLALSGKVRLSETSAARLIPGRIVQIEP